jgi:hypothetical protein
MLRFMRISIMALASHSARDYTQVPDVLRHHLSLAFPPAHECAPLPDAHHLYLHVHARLRLRRKLLLLLLLLLRRTAACCNYRAGAAFCYAYS